MTPDAKKTVGIGQSKPRIILDTNTFISGFFFAGGIPRTAIRIAMNRYQLVCSNETWDELADVFQRDKFEPKLARGQRLRVLAELARYIEIAGAKSLITDCRDAKDNKFLALALDAAVTTIVTGDKALLDLHPWRGINIVRMSDFVRDNEGSLDS
jgi:putative PIN family toxin of toxin-antitoxin system